METRQMIEKRPIAETLRNMAVGDVEVFPISQYTSVRNTPYNAMSTDTYNGMKFSIKRDMEKGELTVTRTA